MNVLSILATILGLISIAGGAAGYFKASKGRTVIDLQGAEIDSLRRTNTDLEKAVAQLRGEGIAKDKTIEEQLKRITDLRELGQGSPQLKKLTAAVKEQTKVMTKLWQEKNK